MATSTVTPTLDPVTAAQFAAFQEQQRQQQAANIAPETLSQAAIAAPSYVPPIDTWIDAAIVRFATNVTDKNGESLSIAFRDVNAPETQPESWAVLSFNAHKIAKGKGKGSRWTGAENLEKSLDILDFLGIDLSRFDKVADEDLDEVLIQTYAGLVPEIGADGETPTGAMVAKTPASIKLEWETYEGESVLKVAHIQAQKGRAVKAAPVRNISALQKKRNK